MGHKLTVIVLVMIVPLIIWIGVFGYLMLIDRTLRRHEREEEGQDKL